jgi:4-hydroxybenzoate polyprenyltransferase
LRTLGRAVRPHFFLFPAAVALAGSARGSQSVDWRIVVATFTMGIAWAVGQLLNDLSDVEADRIDAPDRPAVLGLLPEGPTAAVAIGLGIFVAALGAIVHPSAWLLLLLSATLLVIYGPAKAIPVLGNLAHGALIAVVTAIGCAASMPSASLGAVIRAAWPVMLATAALSALYLLANYEKDCEGDARAGYRTLPLVIGIRASALFRAFGAIALGTWMMRAGLVENALSRALLGAALLSTIASSFSAIRSGTALGALAGYRWAVHGTTAALIAPAAGLLGAPATLVVLALGIVIVERAFSKSKNP